MTTHCHKSCNCWWGHFICS